MLFAMVSLKSMVSWVTSPMSLRSEAISRCARLFPSMVTLPLVGS